MGNRQLTDRQSATSVARLDRSQAAAYLMLGETQPRRLYERQGRLAEYVEMVARMKRERRESLASFTGLDEAIVKSIV